MKPSPITKGLFVGGIGMLLVSVLFSINGWPAAELFSILGTVITLLCYFVFQKAKQGSNKSAYARHATIVFLTVAISLKSFEIAASGILFLLTFISFLVWFAWSVIEELPSSSQ